MGYRDDRDALRNEVDTLQKELDGARDDQQRLADLEQRLEATRREMSAMEAELARVRGHAPTSRRALVLSLVVMLALALVGSYRLLTQRRDAPARVTRSPLPTPPKVMPIPTATAIPTAIVETDEPSPTRRANAVWTAIVTQAHGLPIARGEVCTISAGVVPDDSGMHATDVEVRCGGLTIYDQRAPLSGMSMLDSGATQRAGGKAGTWVYELAFRDRGERSPPRNQALLDSTTMLGKVWSDNLPEFSVSLAIRKGSAPAPVAVVE
jgi:hypothetical protein